MEEGLLKRLARSAANPRTGLGAFDALLDFKSAAGHIKAAAARKIAYAAIRGTARSALAALRLHVESGGDTAISQVVMATFTHGAAIQSPVRIKGDRTLLTKYINRNMVALGFSVEVEGEVPYVQVRDSRHCNLDWRAIRLPCCFLWRRLVEDSPSC